MTNDINLNMTISKYEEITNKLKEYENQIQELKHQLLDVEDKSRKILVEERVYTSDFIMFKMLGNQYTTKEKVELLNSQVAVFGYKSYRDNYIKENYEVKKIYYNLDDVIVQIREEEKQKVIDSINNLSIQISRFENERNLLINNHKMEFDRLLVEHNNYKANSSEEYRKLQSEFSTYKKEILDDIEYEKTLKDKNDIIITLSNTINELRQNAYQPIKEETAKELFYKFLIRLFKK